jgi:hypothetical protein
LIVNVVGYEFPAAPVCWVGKPRDWVLTNVPPEAVFEADSRLLLDQTGLLANNARQMSLLIDQNEPRVVLARLGSGGPVLSASTAKGLQLWSNADTYTMIIQTYPDGDRVVETLIVASPVFTEVTIQLNIVVGGITFDDGTTSKLLSASSFDPLGQCKVHFNYPAGALTSVCHVLAALQGSTIIGQR